MGNDKFLKLVKEKVIEYFNNHADKTDNKQITEDDVFIVWSCKTLQNNKALASTTVSDGMYYELTYNEMGKCQIRAVRQGEDTNV